MTFALYPTDPMSIYDLRQFATIYAEFEEIFGSLIDVESGIDGFDNYEAGGTYFDGEPVMFLRYRGHPPGMLTLYARNAMSDELKGILLARILEVLGIPESRAARF